MEARKLIDQAGRQVTEQENAAEFEALQLWLDAQDWLPVEQELGEREVAAFAGVLGDSLADDDEVLAALLALAHTPLTSAGRILAGYTEAPHPGFGHLAELAHEEWLFWSSRLPMGQVA